MATLSATPRTILGKHVRSLRNNGTLPAVIYGHGVKPASLSLDRTAFEKVYRQVGESTLLDLVLDGANPVKVLVHGVQHHPVSGEVQHVDFHQVRMDEQLTADIPLKFVGEPKAVKDLGGILVKNLDHLKVECLPSALVHEITVDISGLSEFNQGLTVKDIVVPAGIKVLTPLEELAAVVTAPRSEAELAELKSEVKEDVTKVEKVEGEKAAEGEAEAEASGAQPKAAKEEKKK